MARRRPIQPVYGRPPAGFYDPALDAQGRAATRGLGDLLNDSDLGGARSSNDYLIATGDLERQRDEGLADLGRDRAQGAEDFATRGARGAEDFGVQRARGDEDFALTDRRGTQDFAQREQRGSQDFGFESEDLGRGFGRGLSDVLRSRDRANEDRSHAVAGLDRQYRQLGNRQAQSARAQGIRGTALGQALRKREQNQATDSEPIERSFARFGQDSAQQEGRMREDFGTTTQRLGVRQARFGEDLSQDRDRFTEDQTRNRGRFDQDLTRTQGRFNQDLTRDQGRFNQASTLQEGRLRTGADSQLGRLALGYGRDTEDRANQVTRAQREQQFYSQDLDTTRFAQARAAGWQPEAVDPLRRRRR